MSAVWQNSIILYRCATLVLERFIEAKNSYLWTLILILQAKRKDWTTSLIVLALEEVTLAKSKQSSTKNKWNIADPLILIFIGCRWFISIFSRMSKANLSIQKRNKYGDKGSPCQRPLDGWKSSSFSLFHFKAREDDVMPLMIKFIIWDGNLNSIKVSLKNLNLHYHKPFQNQF